MKRFRWFPLVISIFTLQPAIAQHMLNLQQCLESGLKNTPEFQIKQLDILSAEAMHRSTVLEYLPSVSLDGTHTYNIGSVIDPATNNRVSSRIQSDNFALSAQMNVLNFNIFTSAGRTKIAALKAKSDKEAAAAEYALTVLDNYVNVLYTQELLEIQQDQFKNAVFNLNRINKEVELGKLPKSNLYDMQMSYSQEESTMLQTQQLLYNQKLILLQIINDTANKPENVVLDNISTDTSIESLTVGHMLKKSLVISPAVRAAEFKQDFIEKDIVLQRNNFLPVISAFYNYSSFYYLPLNQQRTQNIAPF